MRAIVTGGSGFIGSHLVEILEADGWDVWNIDRALGASIQTVRLNLDNADAIFHLASPVGPVGVINQAGYIVTEVIDCAEIVRRWAARFDCPLIYVSTSEVYGSGGADAEDDACRFGPETSARKEYAVAKLAAETMLRNTPGLDVRIVRPFNVAGPRQQAAGGFVLPRFIAQARSGRPLTVYAPGTQRRAFAHVREVAGGIYAAYQRGAAGEVYNLGNPANATSMFDLANRVLDVMGLDGDLEVVDPAALHGPGFREAPDKLPNIAKAQRDLDWHPVRGLGDIIADAA